MMDNSCMKCKLHGRVIDEVIWISCLKTGRVVQDSRACACPHFERNYNPSRADELRDAFDQLKTTIELQKERCCEDMQDLVLFAEKLEAEPNAFTVSNSIVAGLVRNVIEGKNKTLSQLQAELESATFTTQRLLDQELGV